MVLHAIIDITSIGANKIKQEMSPSLLSTGWFQEKDSSVIS